MKYSCNYKKGQMEDQKKDLNTKKKSDVRIKLNVTFIVLTFVFLFVFFVGFAIEGLAVLIVGFIGFVGFNIGCGFLAGNLMRVAGAMEKSASDSLDKAMKMDTPMQSTKQKVETAKEYGSAAFGYLADGLVYLFYAFCGFVFSIKALAEYEKKKNK